jgi:hypothetical protein
MDAEPVPRPPLDPVVPEDDALAGTDRLVLSDLLNKVLDKGLMLRGSVVISVADIDLVQLDLTLMIAAVETMLRRSPPPVKR